MRENPEGSPDNSAPPPFRIDQTLHQILYKPQSRPAAEIAVERKALPEPPYPIHPDPQPMTKRAYQHLNAWRIWKSWGAPARTMAQTEVLS
jgi:hypothetical protein